MALVAEIEHLLEDYRAWLRDKTTLREVGNSWVEVTTPFIDRHNDALQIYVRENDTGLLLSDDRYTIHDLEASGCSLTTGKRQDLLKITLAGFGVKINDEALEVHATRDNFAFKKHSLIQAMLAVNDLFYLAKPSVESLFLEDVTAWMDDNDIRYTPKAKFTGTSGYDHLFDFVIPKSKKEPERILHTVNRPTRREAESFIYKWNDTKEVRSAESRAYAVLNDATQPVPPEVAEAFRNYSITPVYWTRRAEALGELMS
jgi:hypothetical protein